MKTTIASYTRERSAYGTSTARGEDWRERAACVGCDPEMFFDDSTTYASAAIQEEARAVCAGCPVRKQCLQESEHIQARYGMWGGLLAYERGYPDDRRRRPKRRSTK